MNNTAEVLIIDDYRSEIQKVKSAMKEVKDKRMYSRYHVIYLHLKGYRNIEIAMYVDLCEHTIGTYVNAYKAKGLVGLVMGKSTGAPRYLTIEQEQKLFEVITTQTPDQVGFPFRMNWDTNIAKQWVKSNFGVEYSARGMLDVLHRLNLSFTRPTYTLAKADPVKQEQFKQDFEFLKKPD
jgi:transposase